MDNVSQTNEEKPSNEQQDNKSDIERQKENEEPNENDMKPKRHPLLKYAYRDDQWSPLNTSGKRIYDREFLIELWEDPNCYVKPLNLPDVAIVLNHNIKNRTLKNLRHFKDVKLNENDEKSDEKLDENDTTPIAPPLLKYTYEVDQWSPLNKSGKKVYDREFLIKLQSNPNSKIKPLNLPDLEVVLKDDSRNTRGLLHMMQFKDVSIGAHSPFSRFVKSLSAQGSLPTKRGSQQGKSKSNKPAVDQVSSSLIEDVKLRETENPFRPSRLNSGNASEEDTTSEGLYKTVRRVLNKLMPQKFNALVNQVRALRIDSQEKLQGVVDLVFEKAVNEPRFVTVYALMCKELAMMQVSVPENETDTKDSDVNFRKLIITRCVMEFEEAVDTNARVNQIKEIKAITDPRSEFRHTLTAEEKRTRIKSFGNIRFIGELFKQEVLTTFIMHRCIRHLLIQIDDDSLECLSTLLVRVGKDLESKNQKLDPYFEQMMDIVHGKVPGEVSSRVRFMLQDVIELRMNKWVSRKSRNNTAMMNKIEIVTGTKLPSVGKPDEEDICIELVRSQTVHSVDTSKCIMPSPSTDNLQPCKSTPTVSSYESSYASTSTCNKPVSTISKEQLARKSASIMEEYLSDTSIGNAAVEVRETFDNSTLSNFVEEALNGVIEKSLTARKQTSQLMAHLISNNILPLSLYLVGLGKVLDTAEDLMIDIPKIWVYLAELIWYPLAEGVHPFCELKTTMASWKNKSSAGQLMEELINISVREKSLEWIKDKWDQNTLEWSDFVQENETFDDFIKKYPAMHDLQSSSKNVSRNVSADHTITMNPNEFSTFENTSSEPDKPSALLISPSTSTGLKDHGSPDKELLSASPSMTGKLPSSMSKKRLAKKSASILDDYLSDTSIDTAALKVRETFDDSTFPNFVREALSKVVNKSATARKQVTQLLTHLITVNILPSSLYLSSFGEVLDASGDVVIDVSKIWVYLAELIWYPLAQGVHEFSELKTMMAPLKNKGLAGTLMGELMIVLVREKSPEWITEKWNQSGLEWSDFLQENQSPADFIKKYKLELIFRNSSSSHGNANGQLSMEQIHEQLLRLISNDKESSLDNICNWISVNVGERASKPEFINVLMTVILEVSIQRYHTTWQFKVNKFQHLQALIPRYIDDDIKLPELQCLIAIQEYMYQVEHPQRVILQILEKQIYESILSFDVFHVWESNTVMTPLAGKSVAMLAVKSFFASLRGSKDESSLNKT